MRILNFVRTESYVSLVEDDAATIPEPQKIPSYVFGIDKEGEYLRVEKSVQEEENFFVERRIESDRNESSESSTLLRIESVGKSSTLFLITLKTTHHAFTQKSSSTVRSLNSFYYLQKSLKDLDPYTPVPSLPLKPFIWLYSLQTKLSELSTFLAKTISSTDLLSNKALHLFLQTDLCTDHIQQNLDGLRDDEIKTTNFSNNIRGLFKGRKRKSFISHLKFIKENGGKEPLKNSL
eukprot:GFUD01029606.1.p1 GENE.GFUD01029606.1~~GFUD01029606.1.p1  ORF type:complete len:235 (-),score=38.82 GFUD01029606.1:28-732(-)